MTVQRAPSLFLLVIASMALMLGCTKDLDFTQQGSAGSHQGVKVLVGNFISIRSIERVDDIQRRTVFKGYLGTGDQVRLNPGQYHLSTKLEFSESGSTQPGSISTVQISTTAIDSLIINLEAGKTYEVANRFSSRSKWAPEIHQVQTPEPAR